MRQPPLWQLERRGVPEELCQIAGRALHKQRFLRYKTAGHLLRVLERVPVPERRDETLQIRIAELVAARPSTADTPEAGSAEEPPAKTTFDLIARRAKQKRAQRAD